MATGGNEHAVWSLQGNVGQLTYGPLSGQVEPAKPYCGLQVAAARPGLAADGYIGCVLGAQRSVRSLSTEELKASAEAVSWPLPVAEVYVRGNDLVATYRPIDSWPYSPQLYWRAETLDNVNGVIASMSLLVSVQTQLLETCPQISVQSSVYSDETHRITVDENRKVQAVRLRTDDRQVPIGMACCVLRRLAAAPLSFVEIVPGSDYFEVLIHPGSHRNSLTEWRLFADFLEKGVIRRARAHGALVPRKNDVEIAVACCEAAQRLELPLTT